MSGMMTISSFLFILIACIFTWIMCCIKPRIGKLSVITILLAYIIFGFFVYEDDRETLARISSARSMYEEQIIIEENPEFRVSLANRELGYLSKYEWNEIDFDIFDPQNLQSIGGIFQNVILSRCYLDIPSYPSDDNVRQIELLRGNGYVVQGTNISAETIDNIAINDTLLTNSEYELRIGYYGFFENNTIDYGIIYPARKNDERKFIPTEGSFYRFSCTYIGKMALNETTIQVFIYN